MVILRVRVTMVDGDRCLRGRAWGRGRCVKTEGVVMVEARVRLENLRVDLGAVVEILEIGFLEDRIVRSGSDDLQKFVVEFGEEPC